MEKKTIINILLMILISCLLISAVIYIDAYLTSSDIKQDNFGITFPEPPILMRGYDFNELIPDETTTIEFTTGAAGADAFDVSEAQDGSIMAWMEDTTMYVCSKQGNVIYANSDSSSMFFYKTNLTYINMESLDTSKIIDASDMFYYCTSLTKIDGLDTSSILYADSMFHYCSKLTNVNDFKLSNAQSLKSTFYDCDYLTSFIVPDGITQITGTFGQCSNLTYVYLPNSLKTIGNSTFSNCTSLTEITLPNGLQSINRAAFAFANLYSITIPASVTSIGFDDNVSFPSTSTAVFYGNENMVAFYVDPANEHFVAVDGVLFTKDMKTLLSYPVGKTNSTYTIPAGVETINDLAFYWSYFYLTSVNMPASIKNIEKHAFCYCYSLHTINYDGYEEDWNSINLHENWVANAPDDFKVVFKTPAFLITGSEFNAIIPDNAKSIEFIVNKTIPADAIDVSEAQDGSIMAWLEGTTCYVVSTDGGKIVENDTSKMFYRKENLTSVNFENLIIDTIGQQAFYLCRNLASINIPKSVKTIANYAFSNCNKLTSVIIPEGVTSIGESAFINCSSLISIEIPESVEVIGAHAFDGCSSLTSVNIPSSVVSIGDYAFAYCSSLTSINISSSVTSIGDYAFAYCTALTTINYLGTQKQWNTIAFGPDWRAQVPSNCAINFLG